MDIQVKEARAALLTAQKASWPEGFMAFPSDGKCWSCGNDLILNSPLVDLSRMMTGCPKCHRSFVE